MDGDGRWSADVGQADWIGPRLRPWDIRPFGGDSALRVTTVVPGGFERYARLLHPAATDRSGEGADRRVRWAAVAEWSGLPLIPAAGFHAVALPPAARPGPPPFADGPAVGTLDLADASALASVLRGWTATPDDCWFCVWEGFGWDSSGAGLLGDPVPRALRDGPRVRLPNRDYLLYQGPAEAVTALAVKEQTPNLWWPADRAWCVATEIDLQSTYVGGPAALIDALTSDPRFEALPAEPGDPVSLVLAPWVAAWIEDTADRLLADGAAVLETARGTVRARLRRPPGEATPSLEIEVDGDLGSRSSSAGRQRSADPEKLRKSVVFSLTHAIIGLAPEE